MVKISKYLKAFTLIELLVTTTIIILMAVIAIPAYSRYGDKIQFKQKMEEVASMIKKTNLEALNPGKDVSFPYFYCSSSDKGCYLVLYKDYFNGVNNTPSSDEEFDDFIKFDSSYAVEDSYLHCDNSKQYCCLGEDLSDDTCPLPGSSSYKSSFDLMTITSSKTNQSATFTIKNNPFNVVYSITP